MNVIDFLVQGFEERNVTRIYGYQGLGIDGLPNANSVQSRQNTLIFKYTVQLSLKHLASL